MKHARLLVPLLLVLVSLASSRSNDSPKPAPDFTLQSASGQPFSLAAQRGHKVVISFYKGFF